jgi:hypothetical protein
MDDTYKRENLNYSRPAAGTLSLTSKSSSSVAFVRSFASTTSIPTPGRDRPSGVSRRKTGTVGRLNALAKGGEGAIELAEKVAAACDEIRDFKFLYDLDTPLRKKIERIATRIYGADGVVYTEQALEKARHLEEDPELRHLGVCMVKTQLSLSHDPELKGRPTGWILPIRDMMVIRGPVSLS